MYMLNKRTRPKVGSLPGIVTVQPCAQKPKLEVVSYGANADSSTIENVTIDSIDNLPQMPNGHTVRWLNVTGLGDADVLRSIGARFDIHPLILEDISNTWQRPKVEAYDECLFITTRTPSQEQTTQNTDDQDDEQSGGYLKTLSTGQISICLGKNFVITFQERESSILDPVKKRITSGKGSVRRRGADYLAYAILDTVTDGFFPILENYGEQVEDLEAEVIEKPDIKQISEIHAIKRNLLTIRKVIWPQRDMLNVLIRDDNSFIEEDTKLFLRDCYDHTIQLLDIVETCREIATGLVDILLSSQSNRMNEIMKVLTIIATIFIPLSWIAGVYGMNFDTKSPWNMPELAWRYGYFGSLGIMFIIAVGLLFWFWRKGWIGNKKGE